MDLKCLFIKNRVKGDRTVFLDLLKKRFVQKLMDVDSKPAKK
jgi:hypothetical protein